MRVGLALALVIVEPSIAKAQEDEPEKWGFESDSAFDAIHVQGNEIYPTPLIQMRLSYQDLEAGGSIAAMTFEANLPMPFVLVPGVTIGDIYSFLRVEVPFVSASIPMLERTTGVGDIHLIDAAIKYWDRFAAGAGFAMLLPSASDDVLGSGKLAVGPVAGATISFGPQEEVSLSITGELLRSVSGSEMRRDLDLFFVRPQAIVFLPYASYVAVEPEFAIDWESDGTTTLRLMARAAHAVDKRWVFGIEPSWTAFGTQTNDFGLTVITSFVGW